jgi:hypothetical protein
MAPTGFESLRDPQTAKGEESMALEGAASADLKSLELLFDYTKFHIGLYLTLASVYVGAASVKVGERTLLEVNRFFLWPAVISIAIAGFAGGVVASSITQCECSSAAEFLELDIGPLWGEWWPALYWTRIEHVAFWVGIISALLSLTRAAPRWGE